MWQKTASTIGGSKGFYTGSELGQDVVCLSQNKNCFTHITQYWIGLVPKNNSKWIKRGLKPQLLLKWTKNGSESSFGGRDSVNIKTSGSFFHLVHCLVHFKGSKFGSFKKDSGVKTPLDHFWYICIICNLVNSWYRRTVHIWNRHLTSLLQTTRRFIYFLLKISMFIEPRTNWNQ